MTAPAVWTKSKFSGSIRDEIGRSVAPLGFARPADKNRSAIEKITADYALSINYLSAAGRVPNGVSFRFGCAIFIAEVQSLLRPIFDEAGADGATFVFPLDAIEALRGNAGTEYHFDWTNESDLASKIETIGRKIGIADRVAASFTGLDCLSKDRFRKIPCLGRRYPDGPQADFAFCLPRVAAPGARRPSGAGRGLHRAGRRLVARREKRLRALVQTLAGSARRAP